MDYKYRFLVYLALWILVMFIAGWLCYTTLDKVEPISEPRGLQELFLEAPRLPFVPQTYTNGDLIDCLVEHESSGNPNAYNPCDSDGKEKFGLLQFDKDTFTEFCVIKYSLPNEITNPDIQKVCASKMIEAGYLGRWGTKNKCLHLTKLEDPS